MYFDRFDIPRVGHVTSKTSRVAESGFQPNSNPSTIAPVSQRNVRYTLKRRRETSAGCGDFSIGATRKPFASPSAVRACEGSLLLSPFVRLLLRMSRSIERKT